jgi:hypothetical protein
MSIWGVVAGVVTDAWMNARTRSQNGLSWQKRCRALSRKPKPLVDFCYIVGSPSLYLVRFRVTWNERRNPEIGNSKNADIGQHRHTAVWFQVIRYSNFGIQEFRDTRWVWVGRTITSGTMSTRGGSSDRGESLERGSPGRGADDPGNVFEDLASGA